MKYAYLVDPRHPSVFFRCLADKVAETIDWCGATNGGWKVYSHAQFKAKEIPSVRYDKPFFCFCEIFGDSPRVDIRTFGKLEHEHVTA